MYSSESENNPYEIKINENDKMNREKMKEEINANETVIAEKDPQPKATDPVAAEPDYFDQLQRLKAEFVNYKKRIEMERMLLSDLIKGDFINSLLPLIDDFERLLKHANKSDNELINGINLIYNKK